jgi:hypothetical protein
LWLFDLLLCPSSISISWRFFLLIGFQSAALVDDPKSKNASGPKLTGSMIRSPPNWVWSSLAGNCSIGFVRLWRQAPVCPEKILEFAGLELRKMKYLSSDESGLQFLNEFLAREKDIGVLLGPSVLESRISRNFCPLLSCALCNRCGRMSGFAARYR